MQRMSYSKRFEILDDFSKYAFFIIRKEYIKSNVSVDSIIVDESFWIKMMLSKIANFQHCSVRFLISKICINNWGAPQVIRDLL